MSKTAIKDENYYCITGWMVTKLKLSGLKLQIYAIIYGFSQTSGQECNVSREYLATFTGSSLRGVSDAIAKLKKQGLIASNKSGAQTTYYVLPLSAKNAPTEKNRVQKVQPVSAKNAASECKKCSETVQKVQPVSAKSAPNNINNIYNISTTADSKKDIQADADADGFDRVRDTYERVTGSLLSSQSFADINELIKKGVEADLICRVFEDIALRPNIRYRRAAALSELRQLCARGIITLAKYEADKAEYERSKDYTEPPRYRSTAETRKIFEQEDSEPTYYGT